LNEVFIFFETHVKENRHRRYQTTLESSRGRIVGMSKLSLGMIKSEVQHRKVRVISAFLSDRYHIITVFG